MEVNCISKHGVRRNLTLFLLTSSFPSHSPAITGRWDLEYMLSRWRKGWGLCMDSPSDSTILLCPTHELDASGGFVRSGESRDDAEGEVNWPSDVLFWLPALSSEPRYPAYQRYCWPHLAWLGDLSNSQYQELRCELSACCLSFRHPGGRVPVGSFPPHKRTVLQTANRICSVKWSVQLPIHLAPITKHSDLPVDHVSGVMFGFSAEFLLQWYLHWCLIGW